LSRTANIESADEPGKLVEKNDCGNLTEAAVTGSYRQLPAATLGHLDR
jgi:hypothetical protein